MKQFTKLAIVVVSVLVTSAVATVDLCCATIETTSFGLPADIGYDGPEPFDICEGCTPRNSSCELLAMTCDTSFLDNTVAINCVPSDFTVPPGGVELCCPYVVSTNNVLAKQVLEEAGYDGSVPLDVALGCIDTDFCPLLDLRCQGGLLDNTVGVTCIPAAA
ncbi:hypothetical protein K438DRAFT_2077489 [Mycena galopus ATCC 62051]|nr:hypothetical protein K438DRAFT_2077489 [Mycena galopus ATCC 62051]